MNTTKKKAALETAGAMRFASLAQAKLEVGKTHEKQESFEALCKELGKRISSVENAQLCYRAYQAYLREHPDTAHGKGNKADRDPACRAFRSAAAAISGVSPSTIEVLYRVGKAISRLPEKTRAALAGSSLSNSMRLLRQLATKAKDSNRVQLIEAFAKNEKSDPSNARNVLKTAIGLKPSTRTSVEMKIVAKPRTYHLANGEDFEFKAGQVVVRVECKETTGGRTRLIVSAIRGTKKNVVAFLEATNTSAANNNAQPHADDLVDAFVKSDTSNWAKGRARSATGSEVRHG